MCTSPSSGRPRFGCFASLRGFQQQLRTDPGFEPSGLVTFDVRLPPSRYGEAALLDAYYDEAVRRLERLPGVRSATTTSRLPLGGGGSSLFRAFIFDGAQPAPEGTTYGAYWVEVGPEYFETLAARPIAGRLFTEEDDGGGSARGHRR